MIAILPARGGSVRIPGKNIRDFMGRPMIQWPIEAIRASRLFDSVIVSTDDLDIGGLALSLGHVVHRRESDDGIKGTQEVAADVVRELRIGPGTEVCVVYPCSPMLARMDLIRSHLAFQANGRKNYVVSYLGDQDAGCFYWGLSQDFGVRPLEGNTEAFQVDPARFIDINTPEDWARAEAMFDAQRS